MNPNTPAAQPDGPPIPAVAAPQADPGHHVPAGPPAAGAAHQDVAPAPRRSRNPRGPVNPSASHGPTAAPALLELAAAYPMYTEQRRQPNGFLPDAQMLFHVSGLNDMMMNNTERFTRSAPAWIPIVTQLYIAVLWVVMIMKVYVNSGYGTLYGTLYGELTNYLRIDECMIPGPLVPFFQALAAVNGPFEWMGDILSVLPDFPVIWDAVNHAPHHSCCRQLPIPAIILDQLAHFARFQPDAANANLYTTFTWYGNVFSLTDNIPVRNKVGPQLCGPLHCSEAQFNAARTFWYPVFAGFTRVNAAAGQPQLTSVLQLLGFHSQAGALQMSWFQPVAIVMQKYCQFFNGSVPLKSILPVGIGSVVVYAQPNSNAATRDWLYPAATSLAAFGSSRFSALREIPDNLGLRFRHSDHEIETQAEQYAVLTHTNIDWSNINTQNEWTAIARASTHQGTYWDMPAFRFSGPISLKLQYGQVIASRYHLQTANRAE